MTENEGMLLALVERRGPVTAYELYRIIANSPAVSINSSKGQVYPAIRRLKERGLIDGRPVPDDKRNAEQLIITESGRLEVRNWVRNLDRSHIVLDDPLRMKVMSFGTLSREERLEWIAKAKSLVKARIGEVEEYSRTMQLPYHDLIHGSALEILRVRMNWLDDLLYYVAENDD